MLMKAVRKTVIFIWYPFLSSLDAIFFFLFFFEQYLMNILAGDFVHGSWPSPRGKRLFRTLSGCGIQIVCFARLTLFDWQWSFCHFPVTIGSIPHFCHIILLHHLFWMLIESMLEFNCLPAGCLSELPKFFYSMHGLVLIWYIQRYTMPGWMPNSCWRGVLLKSYARASWNWDCYMQAQEHAYCPREADGGSPIHSSCKIHELLPETTCKVHFCCCTKKNMNVAFNNKFLA